MNGLLTSGAFVLSIFGQPVYAQTEPIPIPVVETIEQRIDRVAIEHGIATTSLFNLVKYESTFDPKADNGEDRGLVQINRTAWPDITDEQAFDPEFSLHFASEKIAEGKGYMWVVGNCYTYARLLLGNIPRMADIIPNTSYPRVNGLAIFQYKNKHVAVITSVKEDGFWVKEANYEPFKVGTRFIKWGDKSLVGYWHKEI